MREIGFGISPPISTPSPNVRAPPAPAKVSVRMPIRSDRKLRLNSLDVGHARNRIWNFAADIDAVAKCSGAAGAGEGFGEDADRQTAALIVAEHEDREMIG